MRVLVRKMASTGGCSGLDTGCWPNMSPKPMLLRSLVAKLLRFSSPGAPTSGGSRPDGCTSPTGESDGKGDGSGLSTVLALL